MNEWIPTSHLWFSSQSLRHVRLMTWFVHRRVSTRVVRNSSFFLLDLASIAEPWADSAELCCWAGSLPGSSRVYWLPHNGVWKLCSFHSFEPGRRLVTKTVTQIGRVRGYRDVTSHRSGHVTAADQSRAGGQFVWSVCCTVHCVMSGLVPS